MVEPIPPQSPGKVRAFALAGAQAWQHMLQFFEEARETEGNRKEILPLRSAAGGLEMVNLHASDV